MCNVIATAWDESAPTALSAFVLWRLNWIHPFDDGNGRTARALAYLVACCRLGFDLPSKHPIVGRDRYFA
jgi:fido (protein-threonine AMPylation protein)